MEINSHILWNYMDIRLFKLVVFHSVVLLSSALSATETTKLEQMLYRFKKPISDNRELRKKCTRLWVETIGSIINLTNKEKKIYKAKIEQSLGKDADKSDDIFEFKTKEAREERIYYGIEQQLNKRLPENPKAKIEIIKAISDLMAKELNFSSEGKTKFMIESMQILEKKPGPSQSNLREINLRITI